MWVHKSSPVPKQLLSGFILAHVCYGDMSNTSSGTFIYNFNSVMILYSASNLNPQFKKELAVVLLGNWKHIVDDIKGMPHTIWSDCANVRQCTSVSNPTLCLIYIYSSSDHLSCSVEVVQSHPHTADQTLHISFLIHIYCLYTNGGYMPSFRLTTKQHPPILHASEQLQNAFSLPLLIASDISRTSGISQLGQT